MWTLLDFIKDHHKVMYFIRFLRETFARTDKSRILSRGWSGFIVGVATTIFIGNMVLFKPLYWYTYIAEPVEKSHDYEESMQEQFVKAQNRVDQLEGRCKSREAKIDELRGTIVDYEDQVVELVKRETFLEEERDNLSQRNHALNQEIKKLEDELEVLEEEMNDGSDTKENDELRERMEDLLSDFRDDLNHRLLGKSHLNPSSG